MLGLSRDDGVGAAAPVRRGTDGHRVVRHLRRRARACRLSATLEVARDTGRSGDRRRSPVTLTRAGDSARGGDRRGALGALPPGDYAVRGIVRLEDGTTGRVSRHSGRWRSSSGMPVVAEADPGWRLPAPPLLALVVRLAYLAELQGSPLLSGLMGDSRQYDAWAQQIAGGHVDRDRGLLPGAALPVLARRHLQPRRPQISTWCASIQAVLGAASCAAAGPGGPPVLLGSRGPASPRCCWPSIHRRSSSTG